MPPVGSTFDSRERAREAFDLRCQHWSWKAICRQLQYRSVGAAQSAVNRHISRERSQSTEVKHATRVGSVYLRSKALGERFAAAFLEHDDDRLESLNRELCRNDDLLAKLEGSYAPVTASLDVTVSTVEDTRARLLAKLSDPDHRAALPSSPAPAALPVLDAETEEIRS